MDTILSRLKKLIQQEQGERELGNTGAAELFAAKVAELLAKYKLSLSDVERHKEEEGNPFTYELMLPREWGDAEQKTRVDYTEELAATLAKSYFCRVLAIPENNNLIFVGRKSDVDLAKLVVSRVMRAALIECEVLLAGIILNLKEGLSATAWLRSGGNDEFRFSFFCGFNTRIATRLANQTQELKQLAGESTALVRASKEVDDYLETLNPTVEEGGEERRAYMSSAYHRGAEFGDEVNISLSDILSGNKGNHKAIGS